MSRIRMFAAALMTLVSGGAFAAGPLPIPVPTLPGLALGQFVPAGGGLPGLGSLPAMSLALPPLPSAPQPVVLLLGSFNEAATPFASQLPLVGLVEAGDPMLRPIITPLSNAVYIPVLGASFGNN